jgi:hypothetical protein
MTQDARAAKREACYLIAGLAESMLRSGWPYEGFEDEGYADEDGNLTPWGSRVDAALHEVIDELNRRGPRPNEQDAPEQSSRLAELHSSTSGR